MTLAKLTSKGQLTIPKSIRDYLNLQTGDKIEFILDPEGRVFITPKTVDIDNLFGMIKSSKKVSLEEMDKAISKKIRKRHSN